MKKTLKKSEVLKEGYIKGLKKAQSIIESAIAGELEPEEHEIWSDDWESIEAIKEDIRVDALADPDMYKWAFDRNGEIDDDALYDGAVEDTNIQFGIEMENIESGYEGKVYVTGSLGLWNGRKEAGRSFDGIREAVKACMEDYNKIYVQGDDLFVDAIHHDGTNCFTIFGVDQDALYALSDKVEKRHDPESEGSDYMEIYDVDSLESAYDYDIITKEEFESCFIHLGPVIAKVYGW